MKKKDFIISPIELVLRNVPKINIINVTSYASNSIKIKTCCSQKSYKYNS